MISCLVGGSVGRSRGCGSPHSVAVHVFGIGGSRSTSAVDNLSAFCSVRVLTTASLSSCRSDVSQLLHQSSLLLLLTEKSHRRSRLIFSFGLKSTNSLLRASKYNNVFLIEWQVGRERSLQGVAFPIEVCCS